jgi:hypothetical protein
MFFFLIFTKIVYAEDRSISEPFPSSAEKFAEQ